MGSGSTDDYYITLGNPPSYSYSWQPGGLTGSSVSVSPSTSTTFTLTVLDGATSCTNTATTSVSLLPPTPGTVSITGGTCGNGSITLNAVNYAPASATIQWEEGPVGGPYNLISGANTASYAYTQTQSIREYRYSITCGGTVYSATGIATIGFSTSLSATPSSVCAQLPNPTVTFTTTPTGGSGTYNYSYTGYNVISANAPTTTTNMNQVATNTYNVSVQDAGTGCFATASTTVTGNPNPTITVSSTPSSICQGSTTTLSSTNNVPLNTYTMSSIPYAPVSGTGTAGPVGDDVTMNVPLGFSFTFFGTSYTNASISTNGFIELNNGAPSGSAGCCSGQLLPNASTPNAVIALDWMDLNTNSGGTIDYFNLTSPNRFVVRFNSVATFGATGTVSGEIILYQNTGAVEIHNTSISTTGTTQTQGIEDANGSAAYAVTGRNASAWTATNDAYLFMPNSANPTWTPGGANAASVVVTPASTTTYTATITNGGTGCYSSASTTVNVTPAPTGTISGTTTMCGGQLATITVTLTGTGPFTYTVFDGTNSVVHTSTSAVSTFKRLRTRNPVKPFTAFSGTEIKAEPEAAAV